MTNINDAIPRLQQMNAALEENDKLHAEIAHLQREAADLRRAAEVYRKQAAAAVELLAEPRLTPIERKAIDMSCLIWADRANHDTSDPEDAIYFNALRGLLERIK